MVKKRWIVQYFAPWGDYTGDDKDWFNPTDIAKSKVPQEFLEEEDEDGDFELSVVIQGTHGTKSWGWPGEDKIILLHGGLGGYRYSKDVVNLVRKYAEKIAKELNK